MSTVSRNPSSRYPPQVQDTLTMYSKFISLFLLAKTSFCQLNVRMTTNRGDTGLSLSQAITRATIVCVQGIVCLYAFPQKSRDPTGNSNISKQVIVCLIGIVCLYSFPQKSRDPTGNSNISKQVFIFVDARVIFLLMFLQTPFCYQFTSIVFPH